MKNFYIKLMLFVCAFALSTNANAAEKKLSINPATFTQLQIGNKIGENYEITGIYAKQVKKGPKAATNDWIPKDGWKPYVGSIGTSAGTYIRTDEDNGLVDPGEIHCNIYSQPMAENPDTSFFKIENFFVLIHKNAKDNTKIDTTLVSLYFKCNMKTGQCVVPVQDMDLFISVINRTTGDTYDIECYLGDVPEAIGYPKTYYNYYPCEADLGYGLFTFNIYYFCEMGGFGLSEEKFLMDSSKPEWTEWSECGTAEFIHGYMVSKGKSETGLQEDIVVYKRTYNPDPRVCEYWFEEWGAGYWTRSGVDFIIHINADGTITVPEQLTGGTEVDEETETEFDISVMDVVTFNPDTFLPEFCSSTFDAATKTGTIWPTYFWRPDPESISVTGYFGIYPDETKPNGFDYRFSDTFVIHEKCLDLYVVEGDKYVAILEDKTIMEPIASIVGEGGVATNAVDGQSTIMVQSDNVLMTAVSAANPKDVPCEETSEFTGWTAGYNDAKWEAKNQGDIKFSYIQGSGNPAVVMGYEKKYSENQGTYSFVPAWTYYMSDGSNGLPKMGLYYKFAVAKDGVLKVDVWANKGNRRTFVVDDETMKALPYEVEGYINGKNEKVWNPATGDSVNVKKWLSNAEIQALHDAAGKTDPEDAYIIGAGNQPFWGTISFPVQAGKTYWVFQHSSQIGFRGFELIEGGKLVEWNDINVTPDDPEGWNDLSRPHKLVLKGTYENPDGLVGMIEYAAEDNDDWHQLTEMMMLGETFNDTLVVMFDASREKHVIRFRIKDITGDTSLLPSIEYLDVSFRQYSGIVDKTYTGDSIYQEVECTDVANMQVTTGKYSNNVNAGTASFCIEGVFPYTIGRKLCTFQINPAPLMGSINLTTDSYVYDGQQHCPEWSFTNESYSKLEKGKDYDVTYTDNRYPGTAKVTVKGKGNYTSELTKTFFIDRAPLKDELFSITLPDEDITYDGNEHKASATSSDGVGGVSFTYTLHGESTTLVNGPTEEGHYDIYMKIADGELYYGRQSELIGSFAIYRFDEAEWQSLSLLYAELQQMGVTLPWDIAGGAKNVSKFEELTIREGHVVGISLANKEMTGLFPVGVTAFPRLENIDLSGNKLSGNISTAIAAIRMQNATAFSNLHTLNLSNNKYSGNVGILGNSIPKLSSLNVSNNKFEDLYPALPANIVNLDITHQEMDRVIDLNLSEMSFADMATKVPTILLYNHDIRNYNTSINLLCTKEDLATFNKYDTDEWAMQLAVSNNQISIPYVSKQNTYYGESGDILNVLNMIDNDITDGSTFKIALSFSPGDANFRNGVEATDLQATILYAFGEYRYNPFNFTAADTYKDDYNRINVQDVVCTVNLLLSDGDEYDAKVMECAKTSTNQVQDALPNAMIYIKDSKVILYSPVPVAVISIKADKPVDWTISDYGLSESVRGGMMVGYSLLGNTIPSGENVIGLCHENTTILKAQLSDYAAREIIVRICNNETTALERINIESNEPEIIYDLSGKKIQERTKGVNIIRKGSRHYKAIK